MTIDTISPSSQSALDDIVRLARQLCRTTFAGISQLTATQERFVASAGWEAPPVKIKNSFGALIQEALSALVVPNSANDLRFVGHPWVSGKQQVKSVAGIPIIGHDEVVGVLYVMDLIERSFTAEQIDALTILGRQVSTHYALLEAATHSRKISDELSEHKNTIESIPDILIKLNHDGHLTQWNAKMEAVTGFMFDELADKPLHSFFPDAEHATISLALERAVQVGHGEIETHLIDKHGGSIPYHWTAVPLRSNDGVITGIIGLGRDITELKQVEEGFRRSEARLAEAQRLAHIGNWEFSIETEQMAWSDETYYMFGITPEDSIPPLEQLIEAVHPEDIEMLQTALTRTVEQAKPCRIDLRVQTADEMMRFINIIAQPVLGECSEVVGLVGTVFDITDRKLAEELLEAALRQTKRLLEQSEQSERLLRAVLDTTPDWIFVKNTDFRYALANLSYADAIGKTIAEIIEFDDIELGFPTEQIFGDKEEGISGFRLDDQAILDGRSISGRIEPVTIADGTIRVLDTRKLPLRDASNEIIGVLGFCRDITEQIQAEKALRESEKRFRRLVEHATDALFVLDLQGRILDVNQRACDSLQYSREELLNLALHDIDETLNEAQVRTLSQQLVIGVPSTLAGLQKRKDGTTFHIEARLGLFESDGHHLVMALARDVSERRVLESQLAQAQKLESIGQMAAGIAHEINTPIQYVGDNTRFVQDAFNDLQSLLKTYDRLVAAAKEGVIAPGLITDIDAAIVDADLEYLIEEVPRAIGQSLEGIERVTHIVRAMKEFSHPGSREQVAVDLNRAIDSTVTVARNEWKYVADLITDLDPALPNVPCYPGELNQVILNMIINAAHAIGDTVGDGGQEKGQITISTRHLGAWAEIRISDTGTGIPEAIRTKIFDPFFTTKEVGKGTGQGLAISHSVIVEKHQGKISVESEVGHGTTFVILLPLALLDGDFKKAA